MMKILYILGILAGGILLVSSILSNLMDWKIGFYLWLILYCGYSIISLDQKN